MNDGIKILASVGYDTDYKRQTKDGVSCGREIAEEVKLTREEATELIQALVCGLSYEDGQKFAEKYKK